MDVTTDITSATSFHEQFESKLTEYELEHQGSRRKPWTAEKILEVMNNIRKVRVSISSNQPRTPMEYYWVAKYDVITIANEEYLIFKKKSPSDRTVRIIPRNEYFGILEEAHKSCGHGGRDKVIHVIKSKFYIPKKAVEIFVALCPTCETKKTFPKKGIGTARPIVSQDFNFRGQVKGEICESFPISEDGQKSDIVSELPLPERPTSPTDDNVVEEQRQKLCRKATTVFDTTDDEYETLGKTYAAKLRRMPAPQRYFADRLMNDILFKGLMGNLTTSTFISDFEATYSDPSESPTSSFSNYAI